MNKNKAATKAVSNKGTVAVKERAIEVVQEVTTAVRVGKDVYAIKTTSDGRGVSVSNGKSQLFIPFGQEGTFIANAIADKMNEGTARANGNRRTRTQIAAQKAV